MDHLRKAWPFLLSGIAFLMVLTGAYLSEGDVASVLLVTAAIVVVLVLASLVSRVAAAAAKILFGRHTVGRVLGFALAVVLFPGMITAPLEGAGRAVKMLLQAAPDLAQRWSLLTAGDAATIAGFSDVAYRLLEESQFPLTPLIFGFVTWVLAGHLFGELLTRSALRATLYGGAAGLLRGSRSALREFPETFWAR